MWENSIKLLIKGNLKDKKMYKTNRITQTSLIRNTSVEGETIEQKIERVVNNKEPITDGAPIVYTERKDGVLPQYNPRTDTWDVALDAMDVVSKTHIAKRESAIKERESKKEGENGGAEPTQGTPET